MSASAALAAALDWMSAGTAEKKARLIVKELAQAGYAIVPVYPWSEMLAAAIATPGMSAVDAIVMTQAGRGYPINPDAVVDGPPLVQAWRAMIAKAKELDL